MKQEGSPRTCSGEDVNIVDLLYLSNTSIVRVEITKLEPREERE
jgi:hypothetical protein